MRGVSTPTHEYARVAALYIHSLSIHPSHRDQSLYETVHYLAASTRAYTRVVLRLRAQAEKEASVARARGNRGSMRGGGGSRPPSRAPSPTASYVTHTNHSNLSHISVQTQQPASRVGTTGTFQSPLFRLRRAPLLRVFVPSPDGDWLSDKSVLECEAECKRAGITNMMRVGDVVWDVAVGDEGNIGRLVWDGSYLIVSSILPCLEPIFMFDLSIRILIIRTHRLEISPNTCRLWHFPHRTFTELYVPGRRHLILSYTSICAHGERKLRLTCNCCRIECGPKRKIFLPDAKPKLMTDAATSSALKALITTLFAGYTVLLLWSDRSSGPPYERKANTTTNAPHRS